MLADAGTQIRLAADRCEPYLSDLHRLFFLQVLENRHGKNQVMISITLSTFPSPRINREGHGEAKGNPYRAPGGLSANQYNVLYFR